jgi:hypothetical protein
MSSLRNVLLENVGPVALPKDSLGGDDTQERRVPAVPALDREKLKRDLTALNKNNSRYFIICVVMVLILFLVSIGVVLMNLGKPDVIKIVMAAFGISSAGLITMMIKLWREKSNVELLILLAINMDSDTLKTVVAVLVKRL